MTTPIKQLFTIGLAMILGSVALAKEGIHFENLSLDQAIVKAKAENKNLFIDVYATWCGPCKYLSSEIFPDEDLGEYMNEHFVCLTLDGEKQDGRSLMIDFDLDSYPTMLFLSPEKAMLKKIVGAVPAELIKEGAQAVVDPSTTELFRLNKEYEAGNRERAFLGEYIAESVANDQDYESLTMEFLQLFPDLDLENEEEFIVFCAEIDDRNHSFSKDFFAKADRMRALHGELAEGKMGDFIEHLVAESILTEDLSLLKEEMSKMYPAYASVFGESAFGQSELLSILEEMHADGLN